MSHRWMAGCALVLGGLLAVGVGCNRGPSRVKPPSIDASAAGAEAVKMYDKNGDGKISGVELDKCPSLKEAIALIDKSGTGEITADMITARIEDWQKTKVAAMPMSCRVYRNGQPFAGATVTFYPEKFLGPNLKPAKGTTNDNGAATISVDTTSSAGGTPVSAGIAPGFYRVVVTKEGMSIPAKYSSEAETVLGQEAARDNIDISTGIKFDLKF